MAVASWNTALGTVEIILQWQSSVGVFHLLVRMRFPCSPQPRVSSMFFLLLGCSESAGERGARQLQRSWCEVERCVQTPGMRSSWPWSGSHRMRPREMAQGLMERVERGGFHLGKMACGDACMAQCGFCRELPSLQTGMAQAFGGMSRPDR